MTMPERVLWQKLRRGRCYGIKFRRQHPMGKYVADFYCPDAGLVIELDGEAHRERRDHDRRRDDWLQIQGVEVFRVPAWKVSKDVDRVIDAIMIVVERRMEALHPGLFAARKAEFLRGRATGRTAGPRSRFRGGAGRSPKTEHGDAPPPASKTRPPPPRGAGEGAR
jgi:very-short-patch-repair endonuclease